MATTTDATISGAGEMPDPSDYAAYEAWRDAGGSLVDTDAVPAPARRAPTAGTDEDPDIDVEVEETDEATDEDAQDASGLTPDADSALDLQQLEEEPESGEAAPAQPKKPNRLERRIGSLVNEVRGLKSQLAAREELEGEQEPEEAEAAPPAPAAELIAPNLSDFDGTAEGFQSWQTAYNAYQKEVLKRAVEEAKQAGRQEAVQVETQRRAQEAAQVAAAAWQSATSRWPDYDDRLRRGTEAGAKVSDPMRDFLGRNPELGSRLSLYLADHPEECTRICNLTLADRSANAQHYAWALGEAASQLAEFIPLLPKAPTAVATPVRRQAAAAPAVTPKPGTRPTTKVIPTASRPPSRIRGTAAPTSSDPVNNPSDGGSNYTAWVKARDAELAKQRG